LIGSGANFWFELDQTYALRIDHAASTAFQITGAVWACFGNLPRLNWFLRMRWSSSAAAGSVREITCDFPGAGCWPEWAEERTRFAGLVLVLIAYSSQSVRKTCVFRTLQRIVVNQIGSDKLMNFP